MDRGPPQLRVRHPFLHGVPEQRLDLRTGVEVRRKLVASIDVEDRRDPLHEHPIRVRVQFVEPPSHVLAHTLGTTPASNAIQGTMLARSSHSSRLCAPPPTGPRPSRVGQPAALVVLPSDAPPVAASESANPSSSSFYAAATT